MPPELLPAGVERVPPPWTLAGEGFILVYRFPAEYAAQMGRISPALHRSFQGGLSMVVLVNYTHSNVGPYRELLFIPGKLRLGGLSGYTVSHILVSSLSSVINGRLNWELPKAQADFIWESMGSRRRHIRVSQGQDLIFEVELQYGRLPFPVFLKPLPHHLLQVHEQQVYQTEIAGRATGYLAEINFLKVQPRLFPDVSSRLPLAAFALHPFKITFPPPITRLLPSGTIAPRRSGKD